MNMTAAAQRVINIMNDPDFADVPYFSIVEDVAYQFEMTPAQGERLERVVDNATRA